MVIDPDGKILIAGSTAAGPSVMRFLPDGAPAFNTPAGNDMLVALGNGVTARFASVNAAGSTSVTVSPTGPAPPAGYQTGTPAVYYDVSTTAGYTGWVQVCITYDPAWYINPSLARLMHYEGGRWMNVTTSNDVVAHVVCGVSMSLSPFAVMQEPPLAAQVQQPIDADGSSVFAASRGVVPVKFAVTAGGQPTCLLPPAALAVFRTSGAVAAPVSESVYTMAADAGSSFRIAGCQYVYNLNTKALGKGAYLIQALVGGAAVGNARFSLR
jgi:hypothetical protein